MPVRRAPLTRERVLDAAIELLDANGIDDLSMRKLGQHLGVEAMSLYNHVANKDDMLAAARDVVIGMIELPNGRGSWKTAMRACALSAHAVLGQHVWAAALWHRGMPSQARLRYMEALLACMRRGGFAVEPAYHGYHTIDTFVVAVTMQQSTFPFDAAQLGDVAAEFLRHTSAEEYPYIVEHVREHLAGSAHGNEFEFGLDLLLDSLDRLRRAR